MANTRQEIYDGRGARIGRIETDERGNKRACDSGYAAEDYARVSRADDFKSAVDYPRICIIVDFYLYFWIVDIKAVVYVEDGESQFRDVRLFVKVGFTEIEWLSPEVTHG